jgi:hypothetical protein
MTRRESLPASEALCLVLSHSLGQDLKSAIPAIAPVRDARGQAATIAVAAVIARRFNLHPATVAIAAVVAPHVDAILARVTAAAIVVALIASHPSAIPVVAAHLDPFLGPGAVPAVVAAFVDPHAWATSVAVVITPHVAPLLRAAAVAAIEPALFDLHATTLLIAVVCAARRPGLGTRALVAPRTLAGLPSRFDIGGQYTGGQARLAIGGRRRKRVRGSVGIRRQELAAKRRAARRKNARLLSDGRPSPTGTRREQDHDGGSTTHD